MALRATGSRRTQWQGWIVALRLLCCSTFIEAYPAVVTAENLGRQDEVGAT